MESFWKVFDNVSTSLCFLVALGENVLDCAKNACSNQFSQKKWKILFWPTNLLPLPEMYKVLMKLPSSATCNVFDGKSSLNQNFGSKFFCSVWKKFNFNALCFFKSWYRLTTQPQSSHMTVLLGWNVWHVRDCRCSFKCFLELITVKHFLHLYFPSSCKQS